MLWKQRVKIGDNLQWAGPKRPHRLKSGVMAQTEWKAEGLQLKQSATFGFDPIETFVLHNSPHSNSLPPAKKKMVKYILLLFVVVSFHINPPGCMFQASCQRRFPGKNPSLDFSFSIAKKINKKKKKIRELCVSLRGAVFDGISCNRNSQAPSGVDVINEQTSSCVECAGICSLSRF